MKETLPPPHRLTLILSIIAILVSVCSPVVQFLVLRQALLPNLEYQQKNLENQQANFENQQMSAKLDGVAKELDKVQNMINDDRGSSEEVTVVKKVVEESRDIYRQARQYWMEKNYSEADKLIMKAYTTLWDRPAAFAIKDIMVDPPIIKSMQDVGLNALLINVGGKEATKSVVLNINGITMQTEEVTITAESAEMVKFFFHPTSPGDYSIEICGMKKHLLVVSQLPIPTMTIPPPLPTPSQLTKPPISPTPPPISPPPTGPYEETYWSLLAAFIGALVVVAIITFIVIRRRRRDR